MPDVMAEQKCTLIYFFIIGKEYASFTKHDRYILNMLYNPKIKPGMSEEDVRTVLPAVIRDARRQVR